MVGETEWLVSSTMPVTATGRQPLDKGLDILELLATTEEGLSQAEIAKALERSPNEIYRMLDRLVRRHYVARTSGDRFQLTLKLFALAHQHAPVRRLVGPGDARTPCFRARRRPVLSPFDLRPR